MPRSPNLVVTRQKSGFQSFLSGIESLIQCCHCLRTAFPITTLVDVATDAVMIACKNEACFCAKPGIGSGFQLDAVDDDSGGVVSSGASPGGGLFAAGVARLGGIVRP